MKFTLLLSILFSSLFAYENVGFLMKQKYACIMQGVINNGKLEEVMSKEEAFSYPIRFYIDDDNIFRTDAGMVLNHVKEALYSDDKKNDIVNLFVEENKRYMLLVSRKPMDIKSLYICIETKNWTITK